MNATVRDLTVTCDKHVRLSVSKGYDQETHPFDISIIGGGMGVDDLHLELHLTKKHAHDLLIELLQYLADDATEYLEEVHDEPVSENVI